jgi:hypothetical protein
MRVLSGYRLSADPIELLCKNLGSLLSPNWQRIDEVLSEQSFVSHLSPSPSNFDDYYLR